MTPRTPEDDVIVIGSGLGGLVLGAMLAKRGRKVSIIEQHYQAGGCATIFHRKGYKFEVGLHAWDGFDELDLKNYIFDDLEMHGNVPFVHLPREEFYRVVNPHFEISVPAEINLAIETLGARWPKEKPALKEFFRTVVRIRRELHELFMMNRWKVAGHLISFPFSHPTLFKYRNRTIGDFLDELFVDEQLKLSLVANILYYHDDPRRLSLFWYSLSQGSYFAGGVHFVRGGSAALSGYLADYIKKRGGEILLGQSVERILVDDGRAVGVRYKKTLGSKRPVAERFANVVVANAAPPIVVNELLAEEDIARFRKKVGAQRLSCSFTSLYVGLNKSPKELGNPAYSTVVHSDRVARFDDLTAEFKDTNFENKGFEIVDYSHIDHGLAPAGKHVAVLSLVDYYSNWSDLSDAEYAEKKEAVEKIFLEKLERLIPGFKSAVELVELGTPKTIVKFTRNPEGCIYGFHQDTDQSAAHRLGHETPIKNLYLASAWVNPGGGFTGAMLSGMNCAKLVERALEKMTGRASLVPAPATAT